MSFKSNFMFVLLVFCSVLLITGCAPEAVPDEEIEEEVKEEVEEKGTIILGDMGWDSMRFNAHVAGMIIEKGYGYDYEVILGATPVILEGMRSGDIHVATEIWTDNLGESYADLVETGEVLDLGVLFVSEQEGLWVPTFVIEGDPERNIEPMAPDLVSVLDLPEYWELFKDPEDPSKGRIVGAPPTWFVSEVIGQKVETYELDQYYNYFLPGSDVALATEMISKHEAGEPIVAYHWTPDWVIGLYDWTLLEEPPYSPELWEDGYGCKYPPQDVTKAISKDLSDWAPEVVEFLEKMVLSVDVHNEALAYMQENDVDADAAALYFLSEYQDEWTPWVPADVAEKIKQAL